MKELAIILSKLKDFPSPNIKLEQYSTDSNIAAEILWQAKMKGDVENRIVLDPAAGPGILGIGALILGAKKVIFIDKDPETKKLIEENIKSLGKKNYEIIIKDFQEYNEKADTIIQNPPFGTKNKNIDQVFLKKAMELAPIIYTIHKTSTKAFIEKLIKNNNYKITDYNEYLFPLKYSMKHHQKRVKKIEVSCWRIEKDL
jgi:putative methylase